VPRHSKIEHVFRARARTHLQQECGEALKGVLAAKQQEMVLGMTPRSTVLGITIKKDGDKWRRVVPSPLPKRIFEIRPMKWLLEKGTVVIAAGGGGIPTVYEPGRVLRGIEAVIDKDLCSELLARELAADVFIMATDADAVFLDWGKPTAKAFRRASPKALREFSFPTGSMGPKVEAACHFAEATGKKAAIGALKDLRSILRGEAGTTVDAAASTIEWAA
jgi:carbamate kinase